MRRLNSIARPYNEQCSAYYNYIIFAWLGTRTKYFIICARQQQMSAITMSKNSNNCDPDCIIICYMLTGGDCIHVLQVSEQSRPDEVVYIEIIIIIIIM